MALKTKTHVALTSGTWASELESILVLRPLQPQARDGCLATHTAVARTTNRLARKVHAFPKIRDTRQRVNGVAPSCAATLSIARICFLDAPGHDSDTRGFSCSPLSQGTSTPPNWRRAA